VKPDTIGALNALVSESIDLVVHTERGPRGPQVSEILAVEDLAGGTEAVQFTATEVFTRRAADGALRWTGQVPVRAADRMARRGIEVRAVLGADPERSER
jgi:pilus assembly protein CpaF